MKIKKIITVLAIVAMFITLFASLSACNSNKDNGPVVLDFRTTKESDLSKYVGKEVIMYGYFTLNSSIDNLAYLAPVPYTAIYNDQSQYKEPTYIQIGIEQLTMPIYFSQTPIYTSSIIKITGTLKKVNTYDDKNYVGYIYAIVDAKQSLVDSYMLGVGLKEFTTFAQEGYTDVLYQNLLSLQLYALSIDSEFPSELNYNDIKADFDTMTLITMHNEYWKLMERTHALFTHYDSEYKAGNTIDKEDLALEAEQIMADFLTFIDKYSAFEYLKNPGDGFDVLLAYDNSSGSGVLPTDTTESTTDSTINTEPETSQTETPQPTETENDETKGDNVETIPEEN